MYNCSTCEIVALQQKKIEQLLLLIKRLEEENKKLKNK
jgi:hypothetical protein